MISNWAEVYLYIPTQGPFRVVPITIKWRAKFNICIFVNVQRLKEVYLFLNISDKYIYIYNLDKYVVINIFTSKLQIY